MGMGNAATLVVAPTGTLPQAEDELGRVLALATPARVLRRAFPARAPGQVRHFGPLAACSPAMFDVFSSLDRLSRAEVTVTLLGETGTGKDVLARAIHGESPRRDQPCVVFDCGAVPPNLLESELFGHERGAFTGAISKHTGAFERAVGGTLFLDEVGELPLDLQPKLLRVLE